MTARLYPLPPSKRRVLYLTCSVCDERVPLSEWSQHFDLHQDEALFINRDPGDETQPLIYPQRSA